jgi:hypothetical protein
MPLSTIFQLYLGGQFYFVEEIGIHATQKKLCNYLDMDKITVLNQSSRKLRCHFR